MNVKDRIEKIESYCRKRVEYDQLMAGQVKSKFVEYYNSIEILRVSRNVFPENYKPYANRINGLKGVLDTISKFKSNSLKTIETQDALYDLLTAQTLFKENELDKPHLFDGILEFIRDYLTNHAKVSLQEDINWNCYYLDVANKDESVDLKIAMAIMYVLSDGTVIMKNPNRLKTDSEYHGKLKTLSESTNAVQMNLESEADHKVLQINCHNFNEKYPLSVGAMLVFDGSRIFTQSIVFEKCADSSPIPRVFPYHQRDNENATQNPKKVVLLDEIRPPEYVEEYLRIKRINYRKITDTIVDQSSMVKFLEKYSPIKGHQQRFLDQRKPKIFVCADELDGQSKDQYSKRYKQFKELVSAHQKSNNPDVIGSYDFYFEPNINSEQTDLKHLEIIKQLRTTKVFVLLVFGDEKKSGIAISPMAYLLLGIALTQAKHCIILAKSGELDKTISELYTVYKTQLHIPPKLDSMKPKDLLNQMKNYLELFS